MPNKICYILIAATVHLIIVMNLSYKQFMGLLDQVCLLVTNFGSYCVR